MSIEGSLVVVSNRLPITCHQSLGGWVVKPSSGGLVTAMGPTISRIGGTWIGWPGARNNYGLNEVIEEQNRLLDFSMHPVDLDRNEIDNFYLGFSNEAIWPLFHSMQSRCNFNSEYWDAYLSANKKFAKIVHENASQHDFLWINDYQLINCGGFLRKLGSTNRIGFFLHIPFPPKDIFIKLPWRKQLMEALLQYDLLGFQTSRDKYNFLHSMRWFSKDIQCVGDGVVQDIVVEDRKTRVGYFPIGIDYEKFAQDARGRQVKTELNKINSYISCKKFIGIDRLDYTKGLPYKLKSFRSALQRFPELRGNISLIQVVVPSRSSIVAYDNLKHKIEHLIGQINGQFATSTWQPIHYQYRSLSRDELMAYYRVSEVGMITPLEDGMNLVAKEYCASTKHDSVLMLSEFAGAAEQLKSAAVLVNPHDIEGVADAINMIYHMPKEERTSRMTDIRRIIKTHDVFDWVNSFLGAAEDLEEGTQYFSPRPSKESSALDISWWWQG